MRTPRHSTVVAYLALFVALGGTSYAAVTLKPNSVGSREIRNHSIKPVDLASASQPLTRARLRAEITQVVTDPATGVNITLHAQDGDPGPKGDAGSSGPQGTTGVDGPQGQTGQQGPRGTALGFAHVLANGTPDSAHSTSNVQVTPGAAGLYCIDLTDATARNLTVTLEPPADPTAAPRAYVQIPPDPGDACSAHQFKVVITASTTGAGVAVPFFATLN